ncbi:translation initiation factor IF-2 N-terminal domain-containing protein, partial [Actinotignum timonense]|nr:translation initiation factor IF-2 N-terminal domain-containing protein [Actinotignum timonense]
MAKVRVHELAKELGVTSKKLLATLKENGEFVKSASSTIEAPVVRKAREYFEAHPELVESKGSGKPAPRKPVRKHPVAPDAVDMPAGSASIVDVTAQAKAATKSDGYAKAEWRH